VLALVADTVRPRFALEAHAFADRVIALARAAAGGSDSAAAAHVERLRLDDLYLASACAAGEEAAWQELAASHLAFVRAFARRFLPAQEAADLADQVMADLWQRGKLGRYGGRSTLRTWLGAVVAHAAFNAMKGSPRTVPLSGEEFDGWHREAAATRQPDASGEDAGRRLRQFAAQAIAALRPADKLLLQLYYEEGLTLDEMAVVLRSSKAALSRRLKHTRETLRDTIESLSRAATGMSADALRASVDLGRLDLDLAALLGSRAPRKETAVARSKSRDQ
jgi:RNA polymerase sigma factor (sigma-70 family)